MRSFACCTSRVAESDKVLQSVDGQCEQSTISLLGGLETQPSLVCTELSSSASSRIDPQNNASVGPPLIGTPRRRARSLCTSASLFLRICVSVFLCGTVWRACSRRSLAFCSLFRPCLSQVLPNLYSLVLHSLRRTTYFQNLIFGIMWNWFFTPKLDVLLLALWRRSARCPPDTQEHPSFIGCSFVIRNQTSKDE